MTEDHKRIIQKEFRSKLELTIDPKLGYGNINDGNIARRFFENSAVSTSITELYGCLIKASM